MESIERKGSFSFNKMREQLYIKNLKVFIAELYRNLFGALVPKYSI
jgi:hypothetical protein